MFGEIKNERKKNREERKEEMKRVKELLPFFLLYTCTSIQEKAKPGDQARYYLY